MKLPMTLLRCAGQPVEQAARTSNVSANGVLFEGASDVAIGSPLEYLLTLTPAMGPRKAVQLHCLGKVVRKADSGATAATIERYDFVRA
jgi:hypothetical protein